MLSQAFSSPSTVVDAATASPPYLIFEGPAMISIRRTRSEKFHELKANSKFPTKGEVSVHDYTFPVTSCADSLKP
ncbi:hypothetical protein AXF42_Ash009468 [Apostasia shenzhenica]|uniref:Uncharacterized protein n=1 Tax=Apostasia shenzhenica TaxID=1088818 RepID=A0A2I0B8W5_9ASPA|nr:hypothetical protein AXF42_Ash009468 [Apostasia shenzhenica]